MIDRHLNVGSQVVLDKQNLDLLITTLAAEGFTTVGPRIDNELIVYSKIEGTKDLPKGIISEQSPGAYNLVQTNRNRYFDFIPGSHSWKQFLFPPRHELFSMVKDPNWRIVENDQDSPRFALLGVRACELAAIHIQDKVFLREDFKDPIYQSRREGLFILAVNCLEPNATCFCTSMGNGPFHKGGFDLCLTELDNSLLVEVGSELGRSILSTMEYELPSAFTQTIANDARTRAIAAITRMMETGDLPELLLENLEADRWTEVGKRCLSCTNCTMVCPTCFCWDTTDQVDLLGKFTRRERVWDSCFNPMFSYVVGGNTRPNIRSRYRQWLTHKLGAWKNQFGMLGCVGCGRCITWCPAGIDLTEEVAAIREEVKK